MTDANSLICRGSNVLAQWAFRPLGFRLSLENGARIGSMSVTSRVSGHSPRKFFPPPRLQGGWAESGFRFTSWFRHDRTRKRAGFTRNHGVTRSLLSQAGLGPLFVAPPLACVDAGTRILCLVLRAGNGMSGAP